MYLAISLISGSYSLAMATIGSPIRRRAMVENDAEAGAGLACRGCLEAQLAARGLGRRSKEWLGKDLLKRLGAAFKRAVLARADIAEMIAFTMHDQLGKEPSVQSRICKPCSYLRQLLGSHHPRMWGGELP